jgi:PAS domain S-box-containing protein
MLPFKLFVGFLFASIVVAIVALGFLSVDNSRKSNVSGQLIQQTHEVIGVIQELSAFYKEMQLESNSYFVTGDSAYLPHYFEARKNSLSHLKKLLMLTRDNTVQRMRADTLSTSIKNLISYTDSALMTSNSPSVNQFKFRLRQNRAYRENIRMTLASMEHEEERLMSERVEANAKNITAFDRTFALLLGGIGAFLVITFFSIRYNFNSRVKVQEELKAVNDLFINLFYESPMGLAISEIDSGVILDCNSAYCELIGHKRDSVIGRTYIELGLLESVQQYNSIIGRVNEHEIERDVEVWLRPKGKDPIWVSVAMQLLDYKGRRRALSAILDMTAQKNAEEDIRRALASELELSKLKSNFITLASHEFRTPLTSIMSSASLIDKYSSGENSDNIKKHVTRISTSVKSLTAILDEFLSLTKIEEGKIEARPESLDISKFLEDLCASFRGLAKSGQAITVQHSGQSSVYIDRTLLSNILTNLVSNAIKYSPENSNINIESHANHELNLSVSDNGIGISKEDQEHLFERFFRASNADIVQGTGLGLHITKHYIDMLHGSIKVESELGRGTNVSMKFSNVKGIPT